MGLCFWRLPFLPCIKGCQILLVSPPYVDMFNLAGILHLNHTITGFSDKHSPNTFKKDSPGNYSQKRAHICRQLHHLPIRLVEFKQIGLDRLMSFGVAWNRKACCGMFIWFLPFSKCPLFRCSSLQGVPLETSLHGRIRSKESGCPDWGLGGWNVVELSAKFKSLRPIKITRNVNV